MSSVASALALPLLGWLVMRVEQLHRAHQAQRPELERLSSLHPVNASAPHSHD